jgi:hypothetical protein
MLQKLYPSFAALHIISVRQPPWVIVAKHGDSLEKLAANKTPLNNEREKQRVFLSNYGG